MNKIFLLLSIFLLNKNIFSQQNIFYIDPTNGNDTNTGTIDQPFKTLIKGISKITVAGSTLFLREGIHYSTSKLVLSRSGQPNNFIKIWAYLNEKPVIDFTGINTNTDGFSISGSYYYLKGLSIKNASHNGVNISGNNNIIENCSVSENKNTGLHLTGSSAPGPSNNLILNCDAFYNFDPPIGGNADGFSAKWDVGPGNIFRGCRAYNNSDDGWDLWMCTGSITIDSCFAFRNGVDIWYTGKVNGNGNGFKLGGSNVATPHIVKNCVSFDNAGNTGRGFDENNNLAFQTVYNCTSFRNKQDNFHFNNTLVSGSHQIKNCISYKGNIVDVIKNATLEKNSWQGFVITDADFLSLDTTGATANRNPDGTLQKNNFMRLSPKSTMIDAGTDIGIPFKGKAPDLGAFESDYTSTNTIDIKNHEEFKLEQNYPNPFNPSTEINFTVGVNNHSPVLLKVYDIIGREVANLVNEEKQPGSYKIKFDGSDLPSGIYYYRLQIEKFSEMKKMMFLK